MKYLTVLLFIYSISINAQTTWIYGNVDSTYKGTIRSIEQISDSVFVTSGVSNINHNNFPVFKLHNINTGEVLKKVKYQNDTLNYAFADMFVDSINEKIILFGKASNQNSDTARNYLSYIEYDFQLNLLKKRIYYIANEDLASIYVNSMVDGFVISGFVSKGIIESKQKYFFCKFNKQGDMTILKFMNEFEDSYDSFAFIVKRPKDYGYVALGDYKFILNDSFKIVKKEINDKFWGTNVLAGRTYNDSTILLAFPFNNPSAGMGIAKIDMNLNILKYSKSFKTPLFNLILGYFGKGIDWHSKDNIYLGANGFLNNKYFYIAKFNSKLELIWKKHFSFGITERYFMWTIDATRDGGCIVGGRRYFRDSSGKNYGNHAFMLKIAANGSIVSNKEVDKSGWDITVFPNPSQGDFKIEIGGNAQNAKLRIFDLQGKEVKVFDKLLSGTNHLNMYELSQGMYIWKLEKDNKIIGSGKWVKK